MVTAIGRFCYSSSKLFLNFRVGFVLQDYVDERTLTLFQVANGCANVALGYDCHVAKLLQDILAVLGGQQCFLSTSIDVNVKFWKRQ